MVGCKVGGSFGVEPGKVAMKVINLNARTSIYTCNAYCLLGDWNALSDVNTIIDPGRDPEVVQELQELNTGVGKKRVEQVIVTHNHYDHTSMLQEVVKMFKPKVMAFSPFVYCEDRCLYDREIIRCADRECEVIHIPGHSQDSICIYCPGEKVLFSGDTPLFIRQPGSSYSQGFLDALHYLTQKDVGIIYPGHGKPIKDKCNQMISDSYLNAIKH